MSRKFEQWKIAGNSTKAYQEISSRCCPQLTVANAKKLRRISSVSDLLHEHSPFRADSFKQVENFYCDLPGY
jgi:hypothetical protein